MLGSDVLSSHAGPIVSSHDFRLLTYVEEADWTTCASGHALIGRRLCVVRSHWSAVTGFNGVGSFGGSSRLSVSLLISPGFCSGAEGTPRQSSIAK